MVEKISENLDLDSSEMFTVNAEETSAVIQSSLEMQEKISSNSSEVYSSTIEIFTPEDIYFELTKTVSKTLNIT